MLEGARRARPDPRARQHTDVTTRATEAMGMVVGFAHRHEHVLAARYTNAKGTALRAAAMVPTHFGRVSETCGSCVPFGFMSVCSECLFLHF